MTARLLITLLGCTLLGGCESGGPFQYRLNVPNPWGTLFRDREDVLAHIPIGSSVEEAQIVMLEHGFQQDASQHANYKVALVFHTANLAGSRELANDIWVTLFFKDGRLADAEVHRA